MTDTFDSRKPPMPPYRIRRGAPRYADDGQVFIAPNGRLAINNCAQLNTGAARDCPMCSGCEGGCPLGDQEG